MVINVTFDLISQKMLHIVFSHDLELAFIYIIISINKNNNYNEIKIRTTSVNKCYYGVTSILK